MHLLAVAFVVAIVVIVLHYVYVDKTSLDTRPLLILL